MNKEEDTEQNQPVDISERERDILFQIIENYIRLCVPIGSRSLSKIHSINFSPATVRNIMADLSEKGYIAQSHISSGRVPTDKGYRLYVNYLRSKDLLYPDLDRVLLGYDGVPDHLDLLLQATVSTLAELTNLACLITYPNVDDSTMGTIEFLSLNHKQALAILVTRAGMVCHKIINLRENLDEDFLQALSLYLNKMFGGMNIGEVKDKLFDSFMQDHDNPDHLAKALRLGKQVFEISGEGNSFIHGQENIFNWPELHDREELRRVYMVLEKRKDLIESLQNNQSDIDVQVTIGKESALSQLSQCSVVSAKYGTEECSLGTIGIIGPTRMDYDTVIPLLSETSKVLSKRIHNIAIQNK